MRFSKTSSNMPQFQKLRKLHFSMKMSRASFVLKCFLFFIFNFRQIATKIRKFLTMVVEFMGYGIGYILIIVMSKAKYQMLL